MRRAVLTALLVLGSGTSGLHGQATARLEGRVIDAASGAPLAGAIVEIENLNRSTVSDGEGVWRFSGVTPGSHRLKASHLGFADRQQTLSVGSAAVNADLRLTPQAVPLDALVVTASRRIQRLADAPVATELISRREIEAAGVTDLSQVLVERLGIHLEGGHPAGEGVMMQGLSSQRVLILLDGQPIVGRISGTLDVARIPTSGIERIEVVKGPQSSLYGSEAMGGVINVITRTASEDVWRGTVSAVTGTQGRVDGSASLNGTVSGFDYLADVGRRLTEQTPGRGEGDGARAERWDGLVKLGWAPSAEVRVEGNALIVDERQRWRSGQLYNFSDNRQANVHIGGEWARGGSRLSPGLTLSQFEHLARRATSPSPVDGAGDREVQRLIEAEVLYNALLGPHAADLGLEVKREHIESDRVESAERTMDTFEPFAQVALTFGDFQLVPGARVTHSEQWGTYFTPRAAVMYRPVAAIALRASVGRGYRAPAFKELGMEFLNLLPEGGYRVQGNPDLRPETSRNVSLGVEWAPGTAYLRLNAFHNDFDDFIETREAGESDGIVVYTYDNIESGTTRGLEVDAGVTSGGFRGEAGYSYLDAQDGETGASLLSRPAHSGRLTLEQTLFAGIRSIANAIYTGKTPIRRTESGVVEREAFLRVDARLTRRLPGGFEAALGARNLFDSGPDDWPGLTGRHVYLGLTWQLAAQP